MSLKLVRCKKCGNTAQVDFERKYSRVLIPMERWLETAHGDCKLIGSISEMEEALKTGELEEVK